MPTIVTASSVGTPTLQADSISDQAGSGSPTFPNGLIVEGPNRSGDGSAASPSISFTNSTTTGLFRKAADSVGFSAVGVEIGFYSNTGAWTFGPSSASVNHISNGSLSFPSTSSTSTAASIYQAGARIRLNGGASGYAFQSSNGSVTHGLVESNGAWTLGDGGSSVGNQYATTHRIFGNIVFQLSNLGPSTSPNFNFSSSPRLMLGWNRTDGGQEVAFIKDGSANADQAFHFYNATSNSATTFLGGTSSAGAWTFGQNIDYTNANRIDTRLNGGLAFRYPISNSIAHRIFVDDGSSIASGQVPLVLQSSYTGVGLNRSFSLHSGAVSGTTNEIAYGLHGGQWSFGRLVTSEYINHEFNGQTINLKGHLSKSSNGVVADFNMTTNRIDNSNNDMRAISRLIGNATPGSRSWDLICFEAPSSYRTLRLQPDGGPVIIGSGGGGERALIYGRLLVGPTAANSSDNSSGLLQTSSTTDNLIHVSLHRGGHTSVNHTISGNSYNIVNSSAGVQLAIGGTGWAGISDIRLKKDVVSLNHGLSEILQIETIRFNYIADAIERPSRIGFSAQNLLGIVPEAVSGTQESMFCVTPTELIPILVKAVQELKSELDVAKARIAVLESAT